MTTIDSNATQGNIGNPDQGLSINKPDQLAITTTQQNVATTQYTVATTQQKVQAMIAEQATILDTQHTRFRYKGPMNRVTSGLLGLNDQSHPQYIHLAFADTAEGGPSYNEADIETGIANTLREGWCLREAIPSLIARSIYSAEKALSSVKIQDAMRAGLITLIRKDEGMSMSDMEWFINNSFVSPETSQHPDVKKAIEDRLSTLIRTPIAEYNGKVSTFGGQFRQFLLHLKRYHNIGLIDDSFLKAPNIQELLLKGLTNVITTESSERTIAIIVGDVPGLFVEGWEKQPGVIETIRKCLLPKLIYQDDYQLPRNSPGFGALSVDEQNKILGNALSQFHMNNPKKEKGLISTIYAAMNKPQDQSERGAKKNKSLRQYFTFGRKK